MQQSERARRWEVGASAGTATAEGRTTGAYALLSGTGQARVLQHWTSARIVAAVHGRTLWTGQFDSTAMGEPAASGDSVVFLDGGGTLWGVRV